MTKALDNTKKRTIRKAIAMLFIMAMAFSFASCKAEKDPVENPPTPTAIMLSVEYAIEDSFAKKDGGEALVYPILSADQDAERNAPRLSAALSEWNEEAKRTLLSSLELLSSERKTKEDANSGSASKPAEAAKNEPIAVMGRVWTSRADTECITLVLEEERVTDGETRETVYTVWTIDPVSGERTAVPRVLENGKENEAFMASLREAMQDGNPAGERLFRNETHEKALRTIAKMTLRERIAQLFIVLPQHLSGSLTGYGEELLEGMAEYPVGGFLFVTNNISKNPNEIKAMTEAIREHSAILPFLSIDEEGGRVARLKGKPGTHTLEPMYEYKDRGTVVAYENAKKLAKNLNEYGFNLDYAPVADVWSNPKNEVIGNRAYGDDPEQTARLVSAAVKGFHDSGIFSCVKHFPGHGDTAEDSHTGAAMVYKTLDELRAVEFLPFQSGIEAGVDMVMLGHLSCPELDTVPASISKKIATDILRGELGFDGLVVTDSLHMGAVSRMDPVTLCFAAFEAGCDMLLSSDDPKGAIEAFEEAVMNGALSLERVNESLVRILNVKYGNDAE